MGLRESCEQFRKSWNLSFIEGAEVFRDSHAILLDDPDQFEDEVRFALLGYSMERRIVVVIHVEQA